jgi:hypothetical protein
LSDFCAALVPARDEENGFNRAVSASGEEDMLMIQVMKNQENNMGQTFTILVVILMINSECLCNCRSMNYRRLNIWECGY